MAVLFWVQHLLGSGHLRRAATLARAIARQSLRVVVASGGPPAPWLLPDGVELVQLPPVRASDLTFARLLDEHDRPIDDHFRAVRRDRLLALFRELRPRVIITEMFPFGRRAFRFELLPLLQEAAAARPRPWRLCSVRDILARKPDPEGYAWMLSRLPPPAASRPGLQGGGRGRGPASLPPVGGAAGGRRRSRRRRSGRRSRVARAGERSSG
jgi:predicted glycosyltransferase